MSIKELMTPDAITLNLQATDAESAIAELAGLLESTGAVSDKQTYLEAVYAREKHGTTAVGFGVAIPHGKSAGVQRAAVAFGRSAGGLKWESMDGQPVHLVFLIAAPEGANDEHLRALSQLARMLMHEETRQKLLVAENPQQIREALA